MTTITYTEVLTTTRCWCGIALAVPDNLLNNCREHNSPSTIYCPLGHRFGWHETKADRLAKELDERNRQLIRERQRTDQAKADAEYQRRQAIAQKGAATKARNRAAKGVCPAPNCRRAFVDVARHVTTCHPEMASTEASVDA